MKYSRWNTDSFMTRFKKREELSSAQRMGRFLLSFAILSLAFFVAGFLLGCFVMGCHLAVELLLGGF